MSVITQDGFWTPLKDNATLTALLSTYRTLPAVFTGEVPDDAALPYVLIDAVNDDPGPLDIKNNVGRQIVRDVKAFTNRNGSVATVESIAEEIRNTFHRKASSISITGFTTVIAQVSGPAPLDDDQAFGRVVTVTLVLDAD